MNLKELSAHLGLSQTTVSRALDGYPEVKEATRKRVADAARAHGYSPNQRARSLATGRSMSIGHVIPISSRHEMVNPIFGDFIAGAGEIYARNGFDMRLSAVADEDEVAAYRNFALNGLVDGFILSETTPNDPLIPMLTELGLPFVVHGRSRNCTTPYAALDVNNRRGVQRATEFLLDLGHRRIGLINGTETINFATDRRIGFEAALSGANVAARADWMFSGDMTETLGYEATRQMLAQPDHPTGLILASIICAFGARRAIEDAGLLMGRDISVICWDDRISYMPNDASEPIFTAMQSSVRAAGRRCASMILDLIRDAPEIPPQEIWEAELIVGRSTAAPPITAT